MTDISLCILGGMVNFLEESLLEDVEHFKSLAYAVSTQKTYKSQRETYLLFCKALGYTPVPASTQTLCRFAALLARTHRYSSIKQYLNIVRILHLEWDLPNPLSGNFQLDSVLKGIRRAIGDKVNRKAPIDPQMLIAILTQLDMDNKCHCAVWAACLLMFYGMLRQSNVMPASPASFDPNKHLRRQDIKFTQNAVILTIRWSKTIQFKERTLTLPLPRIRNHVLCPLQAVFNSFQKTSDAPSSGPALTVSTNPVIPLTVNMFRSVFYECLSKSGIQVNHYSGHSFRRGGASWAYQSGVPIQTIKNIGDWKSDAYQRYIFDSKASLHQAMSCMVSNIHPL